MASGQNPKKGIDTLQYFGENAVNIAIFADGYTIHELDKFACDVITFKEYFFSLWD